MAQRIRGKEITLELVVDNIPRGGSFAKVVNQSVKPKQEIQRTQFNGERQEDTDIDHKGWEGDFEIHSLDSGAHSVLDTIVQREEDGQPHPAVTVHWTETYRTSTASSITYTYYDCTLIQDGESGAGSDYVGTKWKFEAKRRVRTA